MQPKERSLLIQRILETYYPDPPIPLAHSSPFTLLIAVVLSARCTDAMVNRVTPTLFARASTPENMAQLSVEEIRQLIRPCGLSLQKATAIRALSHILVKKYQGMVPSTFAALEALPGVGHKTASVVLAQAFQKPTFPVDTHIYRCARRWGLSTAKSVGLVERDLQRLFAEADWNKLHLQIIHYARRFCPARGHILERCPICLAVAPRCL